MELCQENGVKRVAGTRGLSLCQPSSHENQHCQTKLMTLDFSFNIILYRPHLFHHIVLEI